MESDFYKEFDIDKIKSYKIIRITLYQSFSNTSTIHLNALFLPQTREQFTKSAVNAKIYDLEDTKFLEGEQFNKVYRKTANDRKIKSLLR